MDHSVIVWEPRVRWSACGCLSDRMSHGSQGNWGHFCIKCFGHIQLLPLPGTFSFIIIIIITQYS